MKIMISAAGSAVAPSIISYLKSKSHIIIGIDASDASKKFAIQYCDKFIVSPIASSPLFVDFINSMEKEFDIYIPYIDEELIALANSKNLSDSVRRKIIMCPKDTINLCTDKVKFQNYCLKQNLPIAKETNHVPAIFKPQFGRGSNGIFFIDKNEDLDYFKNKKGVIQKYIQGVEYTVDILCDKKFNWKFGLARKRIESQGISRIGQIDQNKKILKFAKLFVSEIKFSGPINMQFIIDGKGDIHLIEINPRLSGSVLFSVMSGFDILSDSIALWMNKIFNIPNSSKIKKKTYIRYWSTFEC